MYTVHAVACQNKICDKKFSQKKVQNILNEIYAFDEETDSLICPECQTPLISSQKIIKSAGILPTSDLSTPEINYHSKKKSLMNVDFYAGKNTWFNIQCNVRKSQPLRGIRLRKILRELGQIRSTKGFIEKDEIYRILNEHDTYIVTVVESSRPEPKFTIL